MWPASPHAMSLPFSFTKFLCWSRSPRLCLSFLICEMEEAPPPPCGAAWPVRGAHGQALPCPKMEALANLLTHKMIR